MGELILITGGLGLIGGRLAQSLSQAGYRIRLTTRKLSLKLPAWTHDLEVEQLDLLQNKPLDHVMKGVDQVIHLAALNAAECGKNPEEALLVNSLGSLRLLEAAQKAGAKSFVYFSTAHVYGAPLQGRIAEDLLPRPLHPYATSHKAAEDLVLAARDQKKIGGLVLRLSNGLGAPADPEVNCWMLVANDLCRQAVTQKTLTLQSSGLQLRDFIPLSDVSQAVLHLLKAGSGTWQNGLFNLGGQKAVSILEVAQLVADCCQEELGFTPPLLRPEPKPGEKAPGLDYRMDKLLATGFQPQGSLKAEIKQLLRFCQGAFA